MADQNISEMKSSLLKAISDHLDNLERTAAPSAARADRDLYSRTGPGDAYSRTTPRIAFKAADDPSLE